MNTAFALRACVQVLLEQNSGIWHTAGFLKAATGCPIDRVRNVLQQLVDSGAAHMATVGGIEHFGIGVEGTPLPTFQTSDLVTTTTPQPQGTP